MPQPQLQPLTRMDIKVVPAMLWLILLTDTFAGKGGNAADVVLSCPHNFTDGQVSIITCTVNTTSISNSGCIFNPATLDFRFTYTSGIDLALCFPAYPATYCAGQTTPGACFCANQNGEILTYQYNFIAGAGYQGGSFACRICELALRPPQQEIERHCTNIVLSATTSAETTVSTAVTITDTTTSAATTVLTAVTTTGTGGSAADVVLRCPFSFTDGRVSIITCTVNTTRISSSGCYINPSTLGFTITFSAGTRSILCSPAYPATSCAPQTTAGACFCANQSGEILTYQYNFVADTAYQGGSFACSICEAAVMPPSQDIGPHCTNIVLYTTTSAGTTVSTAVTSTDATTPAATTISRVVTTTDTTTSAATTVSTAVTTTDTTTSVGTTLSAALTSTDTTTSAGTTVSTAVTSTDATTPAATTVSTAVTTTDTTTSAATTVSTAVTTTDTATSAGTAVSTAETTTETTHEETNCQANENMIVGVFVLAVLLTVVAVLNVVAVTWFWRQGCPFCPGIGHSKSSQGKQRHVGTQTPVTTNESSRREEGDRQYDTLRLEDIGLRSSYAEINNQKYNTQEILHEEVFF